MYDNPPYHGHKIGPQNARELCIQNPRRINWVALFPKESGKNFSLSLFSIRIFTGGGGEYRLGSAELLETLE